MTDPDGEIAPRSALPPTDSIELRELGGPLWRERAVLMAAVVCGIVIASATSLARAPSFTSRASFAVVAPETDSAGPARGAGMPNATARMADVYAELARQRAVLAPVADTTTARLLGTVDGDSARQGDRTIAALRNRTTATVAHRSGIVSITARTPSASASQRVTRRMLAALDSVGHATSNGATMTMTVIDQPSRPAVADDRQLSRLATVGLLIGGTIGCIIAVGRDRRRKPATAAR